MTNTHRITEDVLLWQTDKIFDLCRNRKDMKKYDGFVPIIPEIYGTAADTDDIGIFMDVTPDALNGPVNCAALRLGIDDGKTSASKGWQCHLVREISTKELRKRAGIFSPKPFSLDVAYEHWLKGADDFFTFRKGTPTVLDIPNYVTDGYMKVEIQTTISCVLGCQFLLENMPHVYLRLDDCDVGFNLPICDLSEVKSLFSLRDIPDGYKRRAALRHWVASHLRRKPSKPDEKTTVKKHLRGKEDFEWFGISGTIYP